MMQGKERHTKNVIQGTSYKARQTLYKRLYTKDTRQGKERYTRHVRQYKAKHTRQSKERQTIQSNNKERHTRH